MRRRRKVKLSESKKRTGRHQKKTRKKGDFLSYRVMLFLLRRLTREIVTENRTRGTKVERVILSTEGSRVLRFERYRF